ncbi:glycoside hydrolase family 5 protein [Natronospora cellulosivora (SeqCode)]
MYLDTDMYAVINIHWDGGWIHKASTDYEGTLEKYLTIWTQVSERFKEYPDYLLFESMNEEGVFEDVWNRYSKIGDKTRAYNILNDLNQEFVDLVRSSGGNNARRHLLIAGYATDIDLTIDSAFKMPVDPENRSAVKVHYYTPSTFTILVEDADWGEAAYYWGSDSEIQRVKIDLEKMKTNYIDRGIAVVLGEYGAYTRNKDPESVRKYIVTVTELALEIGIHPMLWDNGEHYNRDTYSFRDIILEEQFRLIASGL